MAESGWVEILEPETRRKMYANVSSGDCCWEAPEGIEPRRAHDGQWWELHDSSTKRSYFYNANSQATVWERPTGDGIEIIELMKLQQMQDKLAAEDATGAATAATRGNSTGASVDSSSKRVSMSIPGPTSTTGSGIGGGASQRPEAVVPEGSLATHKKGFLIKKKVSIATMLAWSKAAIKQPMLLQNMRETKKQALMLFKLCQMFMGDRPAKNRGKAELALTAVTLAWSVSLLRDELYVQLCKQTTANPILNSCEAGWELMAIGLNFAPPSSKFTSYLEGHISKYAVSSEGRIREYAEHCLKKLERCIVHGPKRGKNEPTLEEVSQAQKSIFNPSVFGSTLEEVMEIQAKKYPDETVPVVVTSLAQAILNNNGAKTEGIFRVPGDIDEVNRLKVAVDNLNVPDHFSEPHVPASTLKLWFRELAEPLVPNEFYDDCIAAYNSATDSKAMLDKIPSLNRRVLVYITRFLQVIGKPENQEATKMTHDNLSMVWAPNFLRCPSEDPMIIMQHTKKEMSFVRHLVSGLDTSEVSHLLAM